MNAREIAALADHEAVPRGLPRYMEAWMVLVIEGRIDGPHFQVKLTLEPLRHAHAWEVYTREGALLQVGEHPKRLNVAQLALFEAVERMQQAGDDVAARLHAWPPLVEAAHGSLEAHIRVVGHLPRVQLKQVATFPVEALTRQEGKLLLAHTVPGARWAMGPNHRYYLRENAA